MAQAFDSDHLGLGFQQDVSDLPVHLLFAPLGVTMCPPSVFGDGVSPSFVVTGLAPDTTLVLAFSDASSAAALVGAENVLRTFDVQFFQWHGLGYRNLDVKAVVATAKRRSWAVVFDGNEPYGSDVQPFRGFLTA